MSISCIRSNSDVSYQLVRGYTCVIVGLALISIIPLTLGIVGKYSHIFPKGFTKGMLISGSSGTVVTFIAVGIFFYCRRMPAQNEES
ncbi:MAG: hypothetical protein H7A36_02510 [Chlamydiales bacterium]|nr:hypothetical protein [Chlamydiales bacterium]